MPRTILPVYGASNLPEPMAEGGRGLLMVAALSDRWGVARHVIGKSVWFELHLASAGGAA
ncbi:ATP-binding protein [Streptomyces odonnellii]|uniref:ATP-binding protein n=1 Tax=Streptomyces odonnellii TaxID=1417980 RepID=UPI000697D84D|nr:ATP-binding protein [Streptomyces odonnellii]